MSLIIIIIIIIYIIFKPIYKTYKLKTKKIKLKNQNEISINYYNHLNKIETTIKLETSKQMKDIIYLYTIMAYI